MWVIVYSAKREAKKQARSDCSSGWGVGRDKEQMPDSSKITSSSEMITTEDTEDAESAEK